MNEIRGDFFDTLRHYQAWVCVTDGMLTKEGWFVAGAGVVKEIKDYRPDIQSRFGRLALKYGERVHILKSLKPYVISFPTAPFYQGKFDLDIITKSCAELVEIVDLNDIATVLIPRLHDSIWPQVKPLFESFLDKRFDIIHK